MTTEELICSAIQSRRLVQFYYDGGGRVVEPHTLARNEANHLALSAWWVRGYTASGDSPRWREYLVSKMQQVRVLDDSFPGPRPGYRKGGGRKFHSIQCEL